VEKKGDAGAGAAAQNRWGGWQRHWKMAGIVLWLSKDSIEKFFFSLLDTSYTSPTSIACMSGAATSNIRGPVTVTTSSGGAGNSSILFSYSLGLDYSFKN